MLRFLIASRVSLQKIKYSLSIVYGKVYQVCFWGWRCRCFKYRSASRQISSRHCLSRRQEMFALLHESTPIIICCQYSIGNRYAMLFVFYLFAYNYRCAYCCAYNYCFAYCFAYNYCFAYHPSVSEY